LSGLRLNRFSRTLMSAKTQKKRDHPTFAPRGPSLTQSVTFNTDRPPEETKRKWIRSWTTARAPHSPLDRSMRGIGHKSSRDIANRVTDAASSRSQSPWGRSSCSGPWRGRPTNSAYWWLSLLIAVPAAGFLVRAFMIQHDCGHGAFFRRRAANDWVGRVIGILTLTPYGFWRRAHAAHHASSGNLDQRGLGDIDTLTVREYLARSKWSRFCYRLYRHPVVLFGIGPAYLFILRQRLPVGMLRAGWQPWLSTMATNLVLATVVATLIYFVGIVPLLLVHLPTTLIAGSIGVWLFFTCSTSSIRRSGARNPEWTFHEAALYGSSHYHLPAVLRWFTANIGMHHIHHLCSRIPYYRLPRALRDYPNFTA